jgi:hypothetical protein
LSESDVEKRPVWNVALANQLPGKLLLVGIAYIDSKGELIEQQQFFGRVKSAHERNGILLDLEGRRKGEQYNLPPDMRGIFEASPGKYTLRSTGEVVSDPDFTVTFSLRQQPKT